MAAPAVTATRDCPLEAVVAHGGEGTIGFRRLVDDNGGGLNFVDLAEVPPGASIGVHTHAGNQEEYYFVVDGTATMHLDGQTVEVGTGDLVRNPPGGTHGLTNNGAEPVRLLVFEVAAP